MKPTKTALGIFLVFLLVLFPPVAVSFTVGWALRGGATLIHKLGLNDLGARPATSPLAFPPVGGPASKGKKA